MRLKGWSLWATALGLVALAPPLEASMLRYEMDPALSHVEFEIGTNMGGDIRGESHEVAAHFNFDLNSGEVRVPIETGLRVESLKTGIALRDMAMYGMFETKRYPRMEARVTRAECEEIKTNQQAVCRLEATLKIRDIERVFAFPVFLEVDGTELRITGEFRFTTRQYELEPPSLLGLIRVKENIDVNFDTVWKQKTGTEGETTS